MENGFIMLNRKLFVNPLWSEARVYSKAEAWIDLIQSAGFEASTVIINGKVIDVQRGELPASRRFLELRWNWGSTKVSNFLKTLSDLDMINQRTNQGQTIIKLLNYDIYNSPQTTGKPSNKPKANQGQTTDKPEANQNKEYKESKELKESKKKETVAANAATLERRKKFGQELVPFIEKYSTTMIRAFYDYWSETNKSGVKMRFELQQTWELPRRLATWAKRDLEFTNRTNKKNNESEDYETKITG